jgi:hypothetical protein
MRTKKLIQSPEWGSKYYSPAQHKTIPIPKSMLTSINPKLPMRNKKITIAYYIHKLGFKAVGIAEYDDYLMIQKDQIQIHFFMFKELNPKENYGQVYIRTTNIDLVYKSFLENDINIHPNGQLEEKPWGQKEFSILDPDHNLLTFGQPIK